MHAFMSRKSKVMQWRKLCIQCMCGACLQSPFAWTMGMRWSWFFKEVKLVSTRALVKILETCWEVGQSSNSTILFWTKSQLKWCRISMCFDLAWIKWKSFKILWIYITWQLAISATICFTSTKERATVAYLLLHEKNL